MIEDMNSSAVLFAAKAEASPDAASYVVGGLLMLLIFALVFSAAFGSILAYTPEEKVPVRLRALRRLTKRFFEADDDREPTGSYTSEVEERMMLMRQLQLIHPDMDPTTLALMAERMQRSSQTMQSAEAPSPYQPKHAGPVKDEVLTKADTTLFVMEVNLYLGFALDVREDHTVHVGTKQYKALKQFCAFRYYDIETPEFTFGRFGLLLLTDS